MKRYILSFNGNATVEVYFPKGFSPAGMSVSEIRDEIEKTRTQKLCSFCSTPLSDEDYNPNDFYSACFQHKRLAQIETEKFFNENPDYTKWQKKASI